MSLELTYMLKSITPEMDFFDKHNLDPALWAASSSLAKMRTSCQNDGESKMDRIHSTDMSKQKM